MDGREDMYNLLLLVCYKGGALHAGSCGRRVCCVVYTALAALPPTQHVPLIHIFTTLLEVMQDLSQLYISHDALCGGDDGS